MIEIQMAQKWLIDREFGLHAMRLVNAMMNGHLLPTEKKVLCEHYFMTDGGFVSYASDGHGESDGEHSEDVETPFITVLHLEGPLTREGGACTYGSRELRDLMMNAADRDGCLGHLLIINGPGGVSNTIPDFMQAIDYAHSKGQPVVGRIDGYCASAHIWVSAMCDEVYYNNPQDRIGSVGIYWAGITNKDGDTDPDTGGTWHIVYDPESYDKNKFYRDLADNNDDTLIKEELIRDGEIFRNYVKSRRPNATDEHLHGKMFDAKDVEGILVNGQATMQEVFERIVTLHGNVGESNKNNSHINNNANMANIKEQFPALFAALQVEEMQMTDEGTFMNAELMARLNDALANKNVEQEPAAEPAAELDEKSETLATEGAQEPTAQEAQEAAQAEIDKIQETLHNAETMLAEKDKEISENAKTIENLTEQLDAAKAELETAKGGITEKDAAIEAKDKTIEENGKAIAEHVATIEKLNKQIDSLKAEVKELSEKPAPMVDAAAGVPSGNGTGAAPKVSQKRITRENMTYEHCREVAKERKAAKQK